jgi:hypothetical protein
LAKQSFLSNAMVNEAHDGYQVSGDEVNAFYEKNKSRWEAAKIKIILIAFKPTAAVPANVNLTSDEAVEQAAKRAFAHAHPLNERSEAEAQKLAADLVRQLRAGADFAKLVTEYSDDAESKSAGGDFGPAIKATSSYGQDLKKVVFAMSQGDVSDPVRQGDGFYIIKLESKTAQPLNELVETIVKEIRDNHRDEYLKDMGKRFQLQMLHPEFFAQPNKYLSQSPN